MDEYNMRERSLESGSFFRGHNKTSRTEAVSVLCHCHLYVLSHFLKMLMNTTGINVTLVRDE
jgi:hypothetical protein